MNVAIEARERAERNGDQVRERRVVVKAEIGDLIRTEERVGEIGGAALFNELVVEDPLIPDVDAGVSPGSACQRRPQMERQRPGKHDGDSDITE